MRNSEDSRHTWCMMLSLLLFGTGIVGVPTLIIMEQATRSSSLDWPYIAAVLSFFPAFALHSITTRGVTVTVRAIVLSTLTGMLVFQVILSQGWLNRFATSLGPQVYGVPLILLATLYICFYVCQNVVNCLLDGSIYDRSRSFFEKMGKSTGTAILMAGLSLCLGPYFFATGGFVLDEGMDLMEALPVLFGAWFFVGLLVDGMYRSEARRMEEERWKPWGFYALYPSMAYIMIGFSAVTGSWFLGGQGEFPVISTAIFFAPVVLAFARKA